MSAIRWSGVAVAAILAMGGWASTAWACTVDTSCSSTCGGQTCYWSGGYNGDYCVAASDPAHSWCNSASDCNCPGAQCNGNHCSIVLPTGDGGGSSGSGGTTGGGSTSGILGGGNGSNYGGGGGGGSTYETGSGSKGCSTTGGGAGAALAFGFPAGLVLVRRRRR
jgi:uncharacterized protein (TIGR03382 family)